MLFQIICSVVWSCFPFLIIFHVIKCLAKAAAIRNVENTMSSDQLDLRVENSLIEPESTEVNKSDSSSGNTSDESEESSLTLIEPKEGSRQDNAIKIFDVKRIMSKYYAVNNSVFVDTERTMADNEENCEYTLYKVVKSDDENGSGGSDGGDFNEHLEIIEDVLKNGRVINNNVYVTNEQWHTITRLEDDLYFCAVCKLHADKAMVTVHMESSHHLRNLNDCQPLKKFDLSITRKINDDLHCAVCNSIYPITEYQDHENSKEHEGNLLFAINKVSDIANQMYTHAETQSIERNNIRPPNNLPSTQNARPYVDIELNTYSPYTDASNVYSQDTHASNVYSQNNNESNGYSQNNNVSNTNSQLIPVPTTVFSQIVNSGTAQNINSMNPNNMPTTSETSNFKFSFGQNNPSTGQNTSNIFGHANLSAENQNVISGNDQSSLNSDVAPYQNMSNLNQNGISDTVNPLILRRNTFFNEDHFSFDNKFKNITIYEEPDEIEEYVPPIEGVSYASMASRPRVEMPKFLKIDLGNKDVRVKFESWHMITLTDPNNYYCMACQISFVIRHKRQHCSDDSHCQSLQKCCVAGAFEDYLIRDVSDKLYHCGHCNNLQVKNDIQAHVEKYHPKNNRPVNINTDFPTDKNAIIIPKNTETPRNTYNAVGKKTEMVPKIDIFGDFKFAPFGSEMMVSNLGCHTLMLVNTKYRCALCDVYVAGNLIDHVYQPNHMELMNMTPFIKPYKCNLTRAIRGFLHCALCNILIQLDKITDHNIEPSHTTALAKSFGMNKNERPRQEIKYLPSTKPAPRTQDEFLNVFPPSLRDAMKSIKVENPFGETVCLAENMDLPKSVPANGNLPNLNLPRLQTGQVVSLNMVGAPSSPIKLKITGPIDSTAGFNQIPVMPVTLEDVEKQLLAKYKDTKTTETEHTEQKWENTEHKVENTEFKAENTELKAENTEQKEQNGYKDSEKSKKARRAKSKAKEALKALSSDEEDIIPDFKLDEIVLIKLKSTHFKISNASYHTFVHVGNGARYCFTCSITLDYNLLQKHADSRDHNERLTDNKYLYNFYGVQLFRQMYRIYHCAICNVTMTRNEVKIHLEWPKHLEKYDQSSKKLSKKVHKNLLKSGAKEVTADTQKEREISQKHEPNFNVVTYIQSSKLDFVESYVENKLVKKSRMIIIKGNVMKICFDSWHGLLVSKNGAKCIICQEEMNESDFENHLDTKFHNVALGITFEKQFLPALVRRINEVTVNCVICNLELPSEDSLIYEHINGRKHDKFYKNIIETSNTDSYTDCYEDPLAL